MSMRVRIKCCSAMTDPYWLNTSSGEGAVSVTDLGRGVKCERGQNDRGPKDNRGQRSRIVHQLPRRRGRGRLRPRRSRRLITTSSNAAAQDDVQTVEVVVAVVEQLDRPGCRGFQSTAESVLHAGSRTVEPNEHPIVGHDWAICSNARTFSAQAPGTGHGTKFAATESNPHRPPSEVGEVQPMWASSDRGKTRGRRGNSRHFVRSAFLWARLDAPALHVPCRCWLASIRRVRRCGYGGSSNGR